MSAAILIALFIAANVVAAVVILALGKIWLAFFADSALAGFIIGAAGVFAAIGVIAAAIELAKRLQSRMPRGGSGAIHGPNRSIDRAGIRFRHQGPL